MCRFKVFLFRVLVVFVNTVMCLSVKWILTRMTEVHQDSMMTEVHQDFTREQFSMTPKFSSYIYPTNLKVGQVELIHFLKKIISVVMEVMIPLYKLSVLLLLMSCCFVCRALPTHSHETDD